MHTKPSLTLHVHVCMRAGVLLCLTNVVWCAGQGMVKPPLYHTAYCASRFCDSTAAVCQSWGNALLLCQRSATITHRIDIMIFLPKLRNMPFLNQWLLVSGDLKLPKHSMAVHEMCTFYITYCKTC